MRPVSDLHTRGYALANVELTRAQCDYLISSIPSASGGRAGVRGLLAHPAIVKILGHEQFGAYLWSVVGRDLVAVKATLFDKTSDSNWRAQWHQDRIVAVREKMDVGGFGPWSTKLGVAHVEPPTRVLEQMVAMRLYLDECGADNGPLRVISGSHLLGKLGDDAIQKRAARESAVELCVSRGAIVLMRPLLVHASAPARVPSHRRVLHIEFAPAEAISPLQWHTTVPLRRAA
jgi:ectoine hydroxylase-related dioxygenase (phytanoyl-CoA dioxygenase family)